MEDQAKGKTEAGSGENPEGGRTLHSCLIWGQKSLPVTAGMALGR
jgi:hypothetical protein